MSALRPSFLLCAVLTATGCASAPAPAQASGTSDANNPTRWAVNRFGVSRWNALPWSH